MCRCFWIRAETFYNNNNNNKQSQELNLFLKETHKRRVNCLFIFIFIYLFLTVKTVKILLQHHQFACDKVAWRFSYNNEICCYLCITTKINRRN